ncbi:hypothetical protein Tco_1069828 [Tanacetum coccineum]|uniref:Uncharacterized protein n=1 Tax=Tanacetum coccineum TaxID=301880 RepID=A0ABQ5HJQ3_9ASTR
MADQSNLQQTPPQQQHDQPKSLESPITCDLAPQVDYNHDQINIKPHNEVALLYPEHKNSEYYKVVSDFIFKEYDEPPTQEMVKQFFPTIGYSVPIESTGTLKKSFLHPRWSVHNWALKKDQPKGPPFTDHMLAICTTNEPIVFQAPKSIRPADKMEPEGKKPGAKTRQRRKSVPLTMNNHLSKLEAIKGAPLSKEDTKSQAGHSKRKKKSGTTKGKNLNQPSASTHMVAELYKEALQATSGPTSFGVIGEVRADPQLINSIADPGKSAPKDLLSQQQGNDEGTQNFSFDHIIVGNNPNVLIDKTQSGGDGLGTVQTTTETKKATIVEQEFDTSTEITQSSDDINEEIKLDDLWLKIKALKQWI